MTEKGTSQRGLFATSRSDHVAVNLEVLVIFANTKSSGKIILKAIHTTRLAGDRKNN